MKRDGSTFVYNCNIQLVKILCDTCEVTMREEILHDAIGRPVLLINHQKNTDVQLVYIIQKNRQWEITSWPDQSNNLVATTYENKGHMISFKIAGEEYVVVTDNIKTPSNILDQEGHPHKEMTYSPFEALIDETNDNFKIPIRYHGGIDLDEAGVILIEGQQCDSSLGLISRVYLIHPIKMMFQVFTCTDLRIMIH